MATFQPDLSDTGRLEFRPGDGDPETIDGFWVPTADIAGLSQAAREGAEAKLLTATPGTGELRFYPTMTIPGREGYLEPKYRQIRCLKLTLPELEDLSDEYELRDVLEHLPSSFVKDPSYGFGLVKRFRSIIRLIEKHTACEEIQFVDGDAARTEGGVFVLGWDRYDTMRAEIDRIISRGGAATKRVTDAYVHNQLAHALSLEPTTYSLGRHPTSKFITKAAAGVEELTDREQDALLQTLTTQSAVLASARPETFQQLHRQVELVSLDQLIETLEASLGTDKNEAYWQRFFEDNQFALQQVFGAPLVLIATGAYVGGVDLSGAGGRIGDYLLRNSLTNNVALVEIKKPSTPLLRHTPYRNGVYGPSTELTSAVTQVLDQAYQLSRNMPTLKENAQRSDLESYAISCFIIAGRNPQGDRERLKSLELHRSNSSRVAIATYDEIVERLHLLRDFLSHQPRPDA